MASLQNRGNGSWLVTICGGRNPDGSKIRLTRTVKVDPAKTINAQRKEVEKQAAALETDYHRHLITDGKKITIAALAEDYLIDHVKRRNLAASTEKFYQDLIVGRIIPAFGKTYVQDLTPREINKVYQKLEKEPAKTARSASGKLSGTYRHKYHVVLHSILDYAVRMGYISVNPADSVEPPRKDTKETSFYELEDCGKLLEALDALEDTQLRLFFYMAIYTGMRPGELIGLNWQDINENVLTVRAGAVHLPGKGTIRTDRPKTKKSVRLIDLPTTVTNLLKQYKKEQAEYKIAFGKGWPEPDAVFTYSNGTRASVSWFSHKFQMIIQRNGLKHITLYGLRHTAATIMIAQGLNVRDVAARLGHSQTSTTLNVYAHAFMDANTRATNAIVEALETARKTAK